MKRGTTTPPGRTKRPRTEERRRSFPIGWPSPSRDRAPTPQAEAEKLWVAKSPSPWENG